jgi:VIT1/CCC1 family predicted Fe2+/Mn2+ transporter
MVKRFVLRGMGKTDAELCVTRMAQYEEFFVNLMVTEELGVQLPEDNDAKLLTDAFIMAIAFAFFGSLPLIVYSFGQLDIANDQNMFYAAGTITAFLVFILGSMKSSFSSVFWVYSGIETVLVAGASSAVAYALGSVIIKILV